eukprot:TRINITY_DN12764_c0_g1_i1.p1 TRINITY_DN12764_c0_g1~~TRINITY_DN12764_c0_g1_i1.p1  ORF type:complete len:119 (+),score=7.38 TRINITY_DN12764_c0_g1_i1:63-419(+)
MAENNVQIARGIFLVAGVLMACTVTYTCVVHGSPFHMSILTPWMAATLIDFYVNVAVLSAWVCYKETTWIGRFIWVTLLICLGSIFTCFYVAYNLFKLGPSDPLYFVLLRERHARKAR